MKQKQFKKIITVIIAICLIFFFGFPPLLNTAKAIDSIKHASDRLSDSDMSQTATHTISLTTVANPGAGGHIDIVLPAAFGTITDDSNITCPTGGTASRSGGNRTAVCTFAGGLVGGQSTTTIAYVTNPAAAGSQVINVTSYDSGSVVLERVELQVYIISDVLMTARVDATLSFIISGIDAGTAVNGVTCTATTTATSTPFGTLAIGTPSTVCQQLAVATNATEGYSVTAWEDNEMTSDGGANINSFDNSPNGTGSSTPHAWAAPTGTLDAYHTYGHMGLTSADSTLTGGDIFGASLYVGFSATSSVEVMYHNGPSNGTTPDKGLTQVAYTAQISALQEAGDYENTLTYIATPIF